MTISTRIFLLIGSVGLGIILVKYGYSFLYEFITNSAPTIEKITPLFLILLALPTAALLWFLRTQDTRENIHQNDLFDVLTMLTDDKIVRREIATLRLLNLVKKVPEYKETTKLAFIKILKEPVGNDDTERRTYAQHILNWLGKEYSGEELDLNKCIFDNQDFIFKSHEINPFKIFTEQRYKNLSFINADLRKVNLRDIDLQNANLKNANLQEASLQGANLKNVNLELGLRGEDLIMPTENNNFKDAKYSKTTIFPEIFNKNNMTEK